MAIIQCKCTTCINQALERETEKSRIFLYRLGGKIKFDAKKKCVTAKILESDGDGKARELYEPQRIPIEDKKRRVP